LDGEEWDSVSEGVPRFGPMLAWGEEDCLGAGIPGYIQRLTGQRCKHLTHFMERQQPLLGPYLPPHR